MVVVMAMMRAVSLSGCLAQCLEILLQLGEQFVHCRRICRLQRQSQCFEISLGGIRRGSRACRGSARSCNRPLSALHQFVHGLGVLYLLLKLGLPRCLSVLL